jgi:SMC interacting uncharacterized protein involved in chromosome segregation
MTVLFHLSGWSRRKTATPKQSCVSEHVKNVIERMDSNMTRKQLEDLSLTKEQVDTIMSINGGDIEKAKSEVANLKTENESLTKQLGDRDKQIDTLKKSAGDNEDLKKQIESLQADNKAQADAHAKEMQQLKVDAAVEKALTDSGALNIKAVRALLELSDAKLSDDGTVNGLAEQIEKLKTDDGSKFMFKAADAQQTFTGFQPGNSTTVPDSKQAGYESRLAEARKNGNQLEVIKIKQEAYEDNGTVLI